MKIRMRAPDALENIGDLLDEMATCLNGLAAEGKPLAVEQIAFLARWCADVRDFARHVTGPGVAVVTALDEGGLHG